MFSYLAISDPHSLNFFLCLKHLGHSLHLLPNLDSPKPTITKKCLAYTEVFVQLMYPHVMAQCTFIMKHVRC